MTPTNLRSRVATAIAASVLLAGALAPAAGARPADSPVNATAPVDLRLPDTRDAARDAAREGYVDLRSPDARDAAGDQAPAAPSAVSAPQSEGVDWVSAAIGAASGAGLVLLTLGAITGVGWWSNRNRTTREAARA